MHRDRTPPRADLAPHARIRLPWTTGPITNAVLGMLGAEAIVMPWGRAYLTAEAFSDRQTRRHEREHLRQLQADGPIVFTARWLWWTWLYGYWWNPYEVAARIRCGEAEIKPGYRENPALWRLITLRRERRKTHLEKNRCIPAASKRET